MLEGIITLFVDSFILGLSFGHGNAKVQVGDPTPLENDASFSGFTFLLLCVHLTPPHPQASECLQWHPGNGNVSCQHRAQCTGSVLHPSIHHLPGGPRSLAICTSCTGIRPLSLPTENSTKDKKHKWSLLPFVGGIHRTGLKQK